MRAAYQRDGWVTLRGFLSEAEVKPIEVIYDKFMVRLSGALVRRYGARRHMTVGTRTRSTLALT